MVDSIKRLHTELYDNKEVAKVVDSIEKVTKTVWWERCGWSGLPLRTWSWGGWRNCSRILVRGRLWLAGTLVPRPGASCCRRPLKPLLWGLGLLEQHQSLDANMYTSQHLNSWRFTTSIYHNRNNILYWSISNYYNDYSVCKTINPCCKKKKKKKIHWVRMSTITYRCKSNMSHCLAQFIVLLHHIWVIEFINFFVHRYQVTLYDTRNTFWSVHTQYCKWFR